MTDKALRVTCADHLTLFEEITTTNSKLWDNPKVSVGVVVTQIHNRHGVLADEATQAVFQKAEVLCRDWLV